MYVFNWIKFGKNYTMEQLESTETSTYPDGNNQVSKDKYVLLGEYLVTKKMH